MDNNDPTTTPVSVWMNWGGNREYEVINGHWTGWRRQIGGYSEFKGQQRRDTSDPCQRAKHERRYRYADTQDMLRHSDGRTFDELCALVGRTAQVGFSDYGCSGERISWSERVTITAFHGSRRDPVYNEEGYECGWITHPWFDVRCLDNGVGSPSMNDLEDIQPPDRVSLLCPYCRKNPDDHTLGCPEVSDDQVAALDLWSAGYWEFIDQRSKYNWYMHDNEPTSSDATFQLGHQASMWRWYQMHPDKG